MRVLLYVYDMSRFTEVNTFPKNSRKRNNKIHQKK
jgi:hypothetical protein